MAAAASLAITLQAKLTNFKILAFLNDEMLLFNDLQADHIIVVSY